MSVNSRKGKPIVTKRKASGVDNFSSLELTIDDAFDRFLSIKKEYLKADTHQQMNKSEAMPREIVPLYNWLES